MHLAGPSQPAGLLWHHGRQSTTDRSRHEGTSPRGAAGGRGVFPYALRADAAADPQLLARGRAQRRGSGAPLWLHGCQRFAAPRYADHARHGGARKPRHQRLLPHRRRTNLRAVRSRVRQHRPPVRADRSRPQSIRGAAARARRHERRSATATTIDWSAFTPWSAAVGGVVIGLAARCRARQWPGGGHQRDRRRHAETTRR